MKLLVSIVLLYFLYQIPVLKPFLKWVVIIIIIGLLVTNYTRISSEFNKIFKGGKK